MSTILKLTKDDVRILLELTLYRNMIGNLLYSTTSRLDISFNVGVCARL